MTNSGSPTSLEPYVQDDDLADRLFATEMRSLRLFGYGIDHSRCR